MERVGFIGVGIMGSGMVHNLLKNGFEVHIFARNRQKVLPTIAEGAVFHETIAECVKSCNTVITMVCRERRTEPGGTAESGVKWCRREQAVRRFWA